MENMKKSIVNKSSRLVTSNYDWSKIVMSPKAGAVTRVILMPAIAPRFVEAKKIAAAVRTVVGTRKTEAYIISKPASKNAVAAKPATKKAATSKPVTKKAVAAKPVAKKAATAKLIGKKVVTRKPAAKKSVPRKSAAKKPLPHKSATHHHVNGIV